MTKSDDVLQRDWGDLEIKPANKMTQNERDIVDLSLRRANMYVDGKNSSPVRPYSMLYSYSPCRARGGRWSTISLRLNHDDGHIYGIVNVWHPATGLVNRLKMKYSRGVRIVDFDRDIDTAIDMLQKIADSIIDREGQLGGGEFIPYKYEQYHRDGTYGTRLQFAPNALVESKSVIINNLDLGLKEMARYRDKLAQERDREEEKTKAGIRVAQAGYRPHQVAAASKSRIPHQFRQV